MNIEIAPEFVRAISSSSGTEALVNALEPMFERVVRRLLDEREERLETLGKILSIGNDAARKRLARDAELRALGVVVGRQWKAKRSTVVAYFAKDGAR